MINKLEIGKEYLIKCDGILVLAVYTGLAEPPDTERELPRFIPTSVLRGDVDPCWPVYTGPKAVIRPVEPPK